MRKSYFEPAICLLLKSALMRVFRIAVILPPSSKKQFRSRRQLTGIWCEKNSSRLIRERDREYELMGCFFSEQSSTHIALMVIDREQLLRQVSLLTVLHRVFWRGGQVCVVFRKHLSSAAQEH